MSVRYTRRALVQLAEIFHYIAQDNPRAAHDVHATIKSSIEILGRFPFAGRATDSPGVRVLTVSRYPYRVDQNDAVVLRIFHAARNQSGV